MSVQAITWAINFPAENTSEKAVLLVLANYADGAGSCFPGQESIAKQAACSERTVRRVLDSLEARGIIAREERRRKDGYRSSDAIVLIAFRQPANLSGEENLTGQSVQSHRSICPTSPATVTATYKDEPSEDTSGEPSGSANADAGPSPDLDKRAWDEAVVSLQRGGLSAPKARSFFGKLLRDNRLTARDLLPSLLNAQINGTQDPQGYLTKAAAAVARQRGTSAPASVPVAQWDDDRWTGALALHRDEGWWSEGLGPPPGQPGCRVPAHLIERRAA